MKKQILALLAALFMLLTLFAGCADDEPGKTPGKNEPVEKKAQMVIAMNPVLVYEDNSVAVAYNDIKNAMKSDREAKTLTSIAKDSAWQWRYNTGTAWKARAPHALDRWTNGAGVTATKLSGYAFSADGSISLTSYSTKSTALTAYAGNMAPEVGVLASVTGANEEALTYMVPRDGTMAMPTGTITAISEVAGVKTGFLAEDGTARSASVRIVLNNQQLWSGTLCNSTAAADGVAVPQLTYPQLDHLEVKAGDVLFISVKLDAQANKDADISVGWPTEADNWAVIKKPVQVLKPTTTGSAVTDNSGVPSISFISNYESTFALFYDLDADVDTRSMVWDIMTQMQKILGAEVKTRRSIDEPLEYEIYIGMRAAESVPESLSVMEELNSRANNVNDFIVRQMGKRVLVMGTNRASMEKAVEHFMTTFMKDDNGAIPLGYNFINRPQMSSIQLDGANIGNYTIRTEQYPSYMVQYAAEYLQNVVSEITGYVLPIVPVTKTAPVGSNEIQIGPMNDGLIKVYRTYDTSYEVGEEVSVGNMVIEDDGYLDKPESYYEAKFAGKTLAFAGGSSYAVNAAVTKFVKECILTKTGISDGYAFNGDYTSTSKNKDYSLANDYAMTWNDEFSYTGSNDEVEKAVKNRWTISSDQTDGPTALEKDGSGNVTKWDEQRRPGVYGENYWIYTPTTTASVANGYLLEITNKEDYGYDAVRLVAQEKWSYRYGIWETRIVQATRNGACSALWAWGGSGPYASLDDARNPIFNEIDLSENFGHDGINCGIITWNDYELKPSDGLTYHILNGDMPHVWELWDDDPDKNFYDSFHHIGYLWTPTEMVFFLDGKVLVNQSIVGKKFDAMRKGNYIMMANGVATGTYSNAELGLALHPDDFLDDVSKFFEVQIVDWSRLFQVTPEGQSSKNKSQLTFSRNYKE